MGPGFRLDDDQRKAFLGLREKAVVTLSAEECWDSTGHRPQRPSLCPLINSASLGTRTLPCKEQEMDLENSEAWAVW
jgi:hypothetical protein